MCLTLNPRPRLFPVNSVRQQENGSAEEQRVEEIVQRHRVRGRGEEHRQVNPQHCQQNRKP